MNSPRSLISTSSSGGIAIRNWYWNWCSDCDLIWGRLQQCAMSHVPCTRLQTGQPRLWVRLCLVITQSLIQIPYRHRRAIAPQLPIVVAPNWTPLPAQLPPWPTSLYLMPARAPDIIVVQACVAHSLQRVWVWVRVRVEYSLWTVEHLSDSDLDPGSESNCVRGPANEFNAAFGFWLWPAHCCVAFFALFVWRFCARVMRIYDIYTTTSYYCLCTHPTLSKSNCESVSGSGSGYFFGLGLGMNVW